MFYSSFIEREDWFYTLSRTVSEHARSSAALSSGSTEVCFIFPPCLRKKYAFILAHMFTFSEYVSFL